MPTRESLAGSLDALIVGAGPTGLTLAGALLRQGLRVRLIDAAPAPTSFSKAIGIQTRTLESLDLLGLADEFVAAGLPLPGASFYSSEREIGRVDFASLASRFPFILTLPQNETEDILARWVARLGGQVERAVTLETFTQAQAPLPSHPGAGVGAGGAPIIATLRHADGSGEQVTAAWLIGCDGAHSRVRRLVGATFRGSAYPESFALADVRLDWRHAPDRARIFFHPDGLLAAFPLPGDRYRLIMDTARGPSTPADVATADRSADPSEANHLPAPMLEEVAALVQRRADGAARLSDPRWLASFRVSARSVNHTRFGRVFLAGDAAHIHSPAGGQGMNTGMQDALNLGWKLALVQRGRAADALLDSYEIERRPIAEGVIRESDALLRAATLRFGPARQARDATFALLTSLAPIERRLVRQVAEVTISYRRGPLTQRGGAARNAGPRSGDFAPDVDGLRASATPGESPTRLYALLHSGASLLLACDADAQASALAQAARPWGDALASYRVAPSFVVTRAAEAAAPLPTLADEHGALRRAFGLPAGSPALLVIRPDGYLAVRATGAGLAESLRACAARALGAAQ